MLVLKNTFCARLGSLTMLRAMSIAYDLPRLGSWVRLNAGARPWANYFGLGLWLGVGSLPTVINCHFWFLNLSLIVQFGPI